VKTQNEYFARASHSGKLKLATGRTVRSVLLVRRTLKFLRRKARSGTEATVVRGFIEWRGYRCRAHRGRWIGRRSDGEHRPVRNEKE